MTTLKIISRTNGKNVKWNKISLGVSRFTHSILKEEIICPPPFNQHYGTCVIMILNKCVSQVNDVAYGPPVNIYTIFFATE